LMLRACSYLCLAKRWHYNLSNSACREVNPLAVCSAGRNVFEVIFYDLLTSVRLKHTCVLLCGFIYFLFPFFLFNS
jgi:hypothetical protein